MLTPIFWELFSFVSVFITAASFWGMGEALRRFE
jgi:hypothetical protein